MRDRYGFKPLVLAETDNRGGGDRRDRDASGVAGRVYRVFEPRRVRRCLPSGPAACHRASR